MYEERWKAELKSVEDAKRRFRENKPKLYWLIRAHMSPESIDRVRAKMLDEFDQLEIMQDPLILWTNTKATHTAYGSGVDFSDASRAEARYHGIKQHERESLSSFKERLETMVKAMQALGLDLPSEQRQAAHLLTKVNSTFEPAARKIEDNYRLSGPYPATTFEAYKMLSELTVDKAIQGSTSVTFTTESAKSTEIHAVQQKEKSKEKDQQRSKVKGPTRYKSPTRYNPSRGSGTSRVSFDVTQTNQPSNTRSRDSPRSTYMTTSDEALNFTTFVFSTTSNLLDNVLLDNQAQASVFGNSAMLSNIEDKTQPSTFKGIGTNAETITATKRGSFMETIKVDYARESTANILSWSELIKQGANIHLFIMLHNNRASV